MKCCWDVETQRLSSEVPGGWGAIDKFGLAIACVEDLDSGEMWKFREDDVAALVTVLIEAELVVGFNSVDFDSRVIEPYYRKLASPADQPLAKRLRHLDIFQEAKQITGEWPSLEKMARANLGRGKTGDGLQAVALYKAQRFDELEAYCGEDVKLTADLWRLGQKQKFLMVPAKKGPKRMVVNW